MKNWKILLPAALLVSALWYACRDQEPLGYEQQADVVFVGRVINEYGQAIEGAQVRAGNELVITDGNGVFRTPFTLLPSRDAKLFVSKAGYFDFSRAFVVQDGALQTVTIQLLRKDLVGAFNGNAGATVQVPGGVTLNFPAGAVNTDGEVRVFARYLDPASPNLSLQMPGDLRAINAGGEAGTLATFGMLGVELTDDIGQALRIADGSEVEIIMPIAAGQLAVAPPTIALWYYDHNQARWIEEGSAQKVGNQYVGKVKHFSFWNYDAFSTTVYMEGRVFLRDDQHPLSNVVIRLTVLSTGFQGFGYTNNNGWFGGEVPKDYAMKLEVLVPYQCGGGQVMYSQDIGPFSGDAVLPPVIISNLPPQVATVNVSGNLVDCNGQPVVNGYAKVQVGSATLATFPDQNGTFEALLVNCDNNTSGSVTGYDLTNLQESTSQAFTISNGLASAGNINVCNPLPQYIQFTLDGQSSTLLDVDGFLEGGSTFLYGYDSTATSGQYMNLSFSNGGQTGTFPLNKLHIWPPGDTITALKVTTHVTEFGSIGNPIIGTFSGTYQNSNNITHTVSGSYRVNRSQ